MAINANLKKYSPQEPLAQFLAHLALRVIIVITFCPVSVRRLSSTFALLTLYRLHFGSNLHENLSKRSAPSNLLLKKALNPNQSIHQILDKFESWPYEVKN